MTPCTDPGGCSFSFPFTVHHLRWKTAAWSAKVRSTADKGFSGLLEQFQDLRIYHFIYGLPLYCKISVSLGVLALQKEKFLSLRFLPGYFLFLSYGQFQSSLPWCVTQPRSISDLSNFIPLINIYYFFFFFPTPSYTDYPKLLAWFSIQAQSHSQVYSQGLFF